MNTILQVFFYSIFSSIILSAAIPNEISLFGNPILTLIAFVPLYLAYTKIKTYRHAFFLFFVQTLITHLISSFWLGYFKDFAIFTLGASAIGTACIGGFTGFFLYLPYSTSKSHDELNNNSFYQKIFETPAFKIIYFTAVYVAYEWVKSSGFLGYPWGTVSSALFRWHVITQLASITGTYGITFIVVMFNAIAAEYFISYFENATACYKKGIHIIAKLYLVLIACVIVHGVFQYYLPRHPVKTLNTVLVQQNSDPWKTPTDNESIRVSEKLSNNGIEEFERQNKKAELVVWSEGVLKHSFPSASFHYTIAPSESPLRNFIADKDVPFLIGGVFARKNDPEKTGLPETQYFNAAIMFDKDGEYRGTYNKNHLVPFAEALPFIEIPAVHDFLKKTIGISAGWAPGDQYVFFDVPCSTTKYYMLPAVKNIDLNKKIEEQQIEEIDRPTVKITAPICFDDAFTDIMRPLFLNGAELFVNITDDSWSLMKSSEIQHFVVASYRAIEYRTTLVRCANAGYSVVVTPDGKVIDDLPLFEEVSGAFTVPIYKRVMTTYARFGNWFAYLCVIIVLFHALYTYLTFSEYDYIKSERKSGKKSKKHRKKNQKKEH